MPSRMPRKPIWVPAPKSGYKIPFQMPWLMLGTNTYPLVNPLAIGAGRQGRSRTRENVLSGAGDFGLKPQEAGALLEQAVEAARGLGD